MKRLCASVSTIAAILLLLVAFLSGNHQAESRPLSRARASSPGSPPREAVRDLQMNKKTKDEPLVGEEDSFRRIPRSGSNPIQNKSDPPVDVRGSRNHQIASAGTP
ncbi:PREDICTED: uncharacterized protein LOC104812274 [Tarenaya hassleriana]|uniref:uncharacterized protein LOC104812274 n=1 Tax=Tarenaya hassleriana TaxID=28532 RepID=UPI00053C756F|nr:PREDICTED: uncharacterized protein LOC104812274 [Tarenaya hassleriana]